MLWGGYQLCLILQCRQKSPPPLMILSTENLSYRPLSNFSPLSSVKYVADLTDGELRPRYLFRVWVMETWELGSWAVVLRGVMGPWTSIKMASNSSPFHTARGGMGCMRPLCGRCKNYWEIVSGDATFWNRVCNV